MNDMPCPRCGKPHDITNIEPSFRRPDAFVAIPKAEREFRTLDGDDICAIRNTADTERRYFVRVLLPFAVSGRVQPISWGIWAEVDQARWQRVRELWRDPEQHQEKPFPGVLANTCPGYRETVGLPGLIQLVGPSTIPSFRFLPEVDHAFAQEQRDGVDEDRVMDWLMPWLHPGG